MAALSFPANPVNGQRFPSPPIPGQNLYIYDSATNTWLLLGKATTVNAGVYGGYVPPTTVDQEKYLLVKTKVDETGTITAIEDNPIPFASDKGEVGGRGLATGRLGIQASNGFLDLLPPMGADRGGVYGGSNINISASGELSVNDASTFTKGVVRLNNTLSSTSADEALTAAQGKLLQDQVNALKISTLVQCGQYDASTSQMVTVTPQGRNRGFVVGQNIPASGTSLPGCFVIAIAKGNPFPPAPPGEVEIGDWLVYNYDPETDIGEWVIVPLGRDIVAKQVGFTPTGAIKSTNVQDAIAELDRDISNLAVGFAYIDNIQSQFNGAQDTFFLTVSGQQFEPVGNNLAIYLGGTLQQLGSAYTFDKSIIKFSEPPEAGTVFTGMYGVPANQGGGGGGGDGSVTSVDINAINGLEATGGPITTSGVITVGLKNTGVNPGAYRAANIVVDNQGRILSAEDGGVQSVTAKDVTVNTIPGIPTAQNVQTALELIEQQTQDRVEFAVSTSDAVRVQVSQPQSGSYDGTTVSIGVDYATTTQKGTVQLSNDPTGASETLALTQFGANLLNAKIDALEGAGILAGTYDSSTGKLVAVSPAGAKNGFVVGQQAPAADAVPDNYYLIVVISGQFGPPSAPIPANGVQAGDWFIVSKDDGTAPAWFTIDFESRSVAAANVSLAPVPGLAATNVQTGIEELKVRTDETITDIRSTSDGLSVEKLPPVSGFGVLVDLTLKPATANDLGSVYIPPNQGLQLTTDGGVTVAPATVTKIGGVIVGDNLYVDASGRLSATGGAGGRAQDITVIPPIPGTTAVNVYDSLTQLQEEIQTLSGANVLAGTYDASKGVLVTVTKSGQANGFIVGQNLPAPKASIDNYYVIITVGGNIGPSGPQVSQSGDWYVCEASGAGASWVLIDYEHGAGTVTASNVIVTPPISGIDTATDAQAALTQIERQVQDRIETVIATTEGLQVSVSPFDPKAYDGTKLSIGLDYAADDRRGIVKLTDDYKGNSSLVALSQAGGNAIYGLIQGLTGGSVLAGTYDATTGTMLTVTPAAKSRGFSVGNNCPSPSTSIDNFYVIISKGGDKTPPGTIGGTVSQPGDWFLCEAPQGQTPVWVLVDYDNRAVDAVNVSLAPIAGLTAANVQDGIQQNQTQIQGAISSLTNSGSGGLSLNVSGAKVGGRTATIALLPATQNDIGGVFVVTSDPNVGLGLTAGGGLSLNKATTTTLGGVIVGDNLFIDANGRLSAIGGGGGAGIQALDSIASQFNGTTTTFTLKSGGQNVPAGTATGQLIIAVGGIVQEAGTAYTFNSANSQISFSSAPPSGVSFAGWVGSAPANEPVNATLAQNYRDTIEQQQASIASLSTQLEEVLARLEVLESGRG